MKNVTQIPRQRLSRSAKTESWHKDTMDAIISISDFSPGKNSQREDLRKLYQYYNGIIDDADYTHVLRPYGKRRKNLPAKLHNYPILKPVVDLLLGEKRRRPFNYSVIVVNGDVNTIKAEERAVVLRENLQQHFINELAKNGLPTNGLEKEDTPPPEEVEAAFNTSYRDMRAMRGQEAMDFLIHHQEIKPKLAKLWKHWLIGGVVVSKKDVVGNELVYSVLNPLHVDYDKSDDTDFIEDSDWATERNLSTRGEIIDSFYDYLTPGQMDQIEKPKGSSGAFLEYQEASGIETKDTKIEVIQVYWKCQVKLGIVTYIDENGEIQEKEVSEGYRVDPLGEESVEWFWVNEVRQGTRIDEDIYINMGEYPVQRESMDNLSKCKLPINGRKYSDLNAPNISLLMLGVPYQLNYNIFKLRLETSIAKSKDLIAQLDINMIPKEWDMDTFMYYVDATGIAWVDYAKEGVKLNPQHQAVLDMSIKTIGEFINLLESVKTEWEELAGVSRQRQGQISQYDGRDTTQQAIVQSAMITEELFALFAEFEQRELQGLIDMSRYAWINGKTGMYLSSDQSHKIMELDGIQHMDSEFGIFVSDSARDQEKIETLKNMTQAFVQNGAPMSTIVDMVEATNFVSLKSKIAAAERSLSQLQQAQQEAEQQGIQEQLQFEKDRLDRESQEKALDRENKIDIALISAETKLEQIRGVDNDGDGIADNQEIVSKERQQLRDLDFKREALRQDKQLGSRKLDLEEKKNAADAKAKLIAARKPAASGGKK